MTVTNSKDEDDEDDEEEDEIYAEGPPFWRPESERQAEDDGETTPFPLSSAWLNLPESPDIQVPDGLELPGYEILDEVGCHGMEVVLRARQTKLNRMVVVRAVPAATGYEESAAACLRREAVILARLRHPHVFSLLDFLEHDGRSFLVMEWIDGETLDQKILDEKMMPRPQPLRSAVRLVERLAKTLSHVHAAGVIHCDLKPQNIFLSASLSTLAGVSVDELDGEEHYGTPMLMRFELALDREAIQQLKEEQIRGTPLYMSPEQWSARHQDLGPPTDIYALGVILYELLTGQRPFAGRSYAELRHSALETDPKPPRELRRKLDARLESICLKCLRKDPAHRYATGAELAADLRAFLERPARRFRVW